VKNRYKTQLAALPLTGFDWSTTLLSPYFPALLVATREPLAHPLANAILATVLANEAVNRCGPLLLAQLAQRHAVDDTAVLLAWARGWAALNQARLFAVLDAHALLISPAVSQALDRRTRALQSAVLAGVLSMPVAMGVDGGGAGAGSRPGTPDTAPAGMAELTQLFSTDGDGAGAAWLHFSTERNPAAAAAAGSVDATAGAASPANADAFAAACRAVDAIESIADFLFAALAVQRPQSMSLPALLQIGVAVRRAAGIDQLEQALMHASATPAQQPLRSHALQTLRRTQQRLLMQVLAHAPSPALALDDGVVTAAVRSTLGTSADEGVIPAALLLDDAILATWTLSERLPPA
jgi:glutamate dehydrogenase